MSADEQLPTVVIELPSAITGNWDDFEKLVNHCFYNELRIAPEEQPLVLIVSPIIDKICLEKITQIMFETFNVPVLYIVSSAAINILSSPCPTGLSIIAGESRTEIVPVYQACAIPHLGHLYPVTGAQITSKLMAALEAEKGYSFTTTAELRVLADMKKKVCYVRLNDQEPEGEVEYEHPDGTILKTKDARWIAPEAFFYPRLLGLVEDPFVLAIHQFIADCDAELWPEMYKNIVVTGGVTSTKNFVERLERDLKASLPKPELEVRVSSPQSNGVASAMTLFAGPTPPFTPITQELYDEIGPIAAHRTFW